MMMVVQVKRKVRYALDPMKMMVSFPRLLVRSWQHLAALAPAPVVAPHSAFA